MKANLTAESSLTQDCILHKTIKVPYNPRQQLLMVDIFEVEDGVEDELPLVKETLKEA